MDVLNRVKRDTPSLPPGGVAKPAEPPPPVCICCGTQMLPNDVLFCRSRIPAGIVGPARDMASAAHICPSCFKQTKGLVSIVCIGCRQVVMLRPASKDKEGFEMKGGETYHILSCPACDESLKQALKEHREARITPIEKLLHSNQAIL